MNANERLLDAIERGDVESVKAAIRDGANVNFRNWSRDSETPLHKAALKNHTEVVSTLLAAGASVNAENCHYETPLHMATWFNNIDVVKMLISNGAEIDTKDINDWTALHIAAWHGYVELVNVLLTAGADVSARNRSGRTPLDLALQRKRTETVNTQDGIESILSETKELEALLSITPEECIIERQSLEARLKKVRTELALAQTKPST